MTLQEQILDLSRQNTIGALSHWFVERFDNQVKNGQFLPAGELARVGTKLVEDLEAYRIQTEVATAVVGMSGGVDSALTAALMKAAGWRVVGFTMPIDQDPEETDRGVEACIALGIDHMNIDLTREYGSMIKELASLDLKLTVGDDIHLRIRRGNIRARLRMITLYDQAHRFGGLVASTDNFSELTAGFWTLHGDVGDLAPIQALNKSWEVPWMAKAYGVPERTWRATPTDGLGISAGDEAQLGASYLEWDIMVFSIMDIVPQTSRATSEQVATLLNVCGDQHAERVFRSAWHRLSRTWHKRANPIRLQHARHDRFASLDLVDARLFQPAVLRSPQRTSAALADEALS